MALCLVALGSNLGDRQATLRRAVEALASRAEVRVVAQSRLRETAPVGGPPDQGVYLNGAVLLETSIPPEAVLAILQDVEGRLGRRRDKRWGPRDVDLDLLLYDQVVLNRPGLVVPHSRMAWRRFVLEPAAEIAGSMVHPTIGWTLHRLLENLDSRPHYVAFTGPIGAGKSELAERLTQRLPGRWIAEEIRPARLAAFYADPSGEGRATEIEFLDQRRRLLAADRPEWSADRRLAISDFWFDQSLAFARVWLPSGPFEEFRQRWQAVRREVVRPKLLVVLDAPTGHLLDRIRRRNRPGEDRLTGEAIDRIRVSILAEVRQPQQGPVLQVENLDFAAALDEAEAAIRAME